MPELKSFLIQQAQVPASIELSLPQGMPKLSSMLTQIAANLPKTPDLPVPGAGNGGGTASFGALGGFPDVASVIKGIEEPLPDMFPKLSGMVPGGFGYRAMPEEGKAEPTIKQPVSVSGYRFTTS